MTDAREDHWVREAAREAVKYLDTLPLERQPAWYRLQGRAEAERKCLVG